MACSGTALAFRFSVNSTRAGLMFTLKIKKRYLFKFADLREYITG
jgi:hypothetical protein